MIFTLKIIIKCFGAGLMQLLVLSWAFCNALAIASEPSASGVKAFLERNCYQCHDADSEKGKFRVDNLPLGLTSPESAKQWGRILALSLIHI